jgi:hypothetical protein
VEASCTASVEKGKTVSAGLSTWFVKGISSYVEEAIHPNGGERPPYVYRLEANKAIERRSSDGGTPHRPAITLYARPKYVCRVDVPGAEEQSSAGNGTLQPTQPRLPRAWGATLRSPRRRREGHARLKP